MKLRIEKSGNGHIVLDDDAREAVGVIEYREPIKALVFEVFASFYTLDHLKQIIDGMKEIPIPNVDKTYKRIFNPEGKKMLCGRCGKYHTDFYDNGNGFAVCYWCRDFENEVAK